MPTSPARERKRDSKTPEHEVPQGDHKTQAAQAEQSRSPKCKRTGRTTFLSLRCELRQAILYLTVDDSRLRALINEETARCSLQRDPIRWHDSESFYADEEWDKAVHDHREETFRWITTLERTTDSVPIKEDVRYVETKWKVDREKLEDEWLLVHRVLV